MTQEKSERPTGLVPLYIKRWCTIIHVPPAIRDQIRRELGFVDLDDDETLLPCPFCGGEAERFECEETDNMGGHVIGCKLCQASTRVFFGDCSDVLRETSR